MVTPGSLIDKLLSTLPQVGTVTWIGVRPARRAALLPLDAVRAEVGSGLVGDHYGGKQIGKRQVTLMNEEHLAAIAGMLSKEVTPTLLRRNVVVRGINLLALKDRTFRVGPEVILETTGLCHPCSRMEQNLGPGGYNAVRGHGGITARVLRAGTIRVGDEVVVIDEEMT